ncbi:MAG: archaeosine biosynthesis radical SAM protein RaSEA [Methanolinea sp.]|nr:archaeosine biosynthesis radical SAM protein RaSEA [Methanolinea sp.]
MADEYQDKPLAAWLGRDRYRDDILPSLTVILKTGGCRWNRCRMCSYRHERYGAMDSRELESRLLGQLDWIRNEFRIQDIEIVKIYTSGSFFDPAEVPERILDEASRLFFGKLVIAETRPEFVNEEVLTNFIDRIGNGSWEIPLYVAIGVETTNDSIRDKSIRKGFTFQDFRRGAEIARAAGAGVKAYLLAKPLFLTEKEAIEDMQSSIRDLKGHAEMISMNPCTVQRGTELEWFWKQGAYRPPYLWSILSILRDSPVHLSCDPLGGGQPRGSHNCGTCDPPLVKGIRDYSLSGDRLLLDELLDTQCPCRKEWEFVLGEEKSYCMPLTR